jgi:amphi-Trp domain-containing protein
MVNLPNNKTDNEPTIITDGFFEREVHLSRELTATFLHELADQIDAGSELTISSDNWKIPFEFREPIEVEVEHSSHREKELELEIGFEEPQEYDGLSVE